MFGKMFLSFFLVFAIWTASTNASDILTHCIDVEPFSVEENGIIYPYNSNLIGFKFNPSKVAIAKDDGSDEVDLLVKDTIVTYQAMSIATKSYFITQFVGQAKLNDNTISECSVRAELKNKDETNGLPSKMVKAILEKASECLNKKLCNAIGTVGEEEFNRA